MTLSSLFCSYGKILFGLVATGNSMVVLLDLLKEQPYDFVSSCLSMLKTFERIIQ